MILVGNFPGRSKFDVTLEEGEPNWSSLPVVNALLLSYEFPNSLDEVITGVPLKQKQPVKARIQIAKNAFAKGVERAAYYGRDLTSEKRPVNIVLKKYIGPKGFLNNVVHYETSIQLQTVAAYMASKFSTELMEKVSFCMNNKIVFCYIFNN